MPVPGSCSRSTESESLKGRLQESAFPSGSVGISCRGKLGNFCKIEEGDGTNAYFWKVQLKLNKSFLMPLTAAGKFCKGGKGIS